MFRNKFFINFKFILFIFNTLFILNISSIIIKSADINYILPMGKSVLLPCENHAYEEINWNSEDPQIATVDRDGVVDSKSVGKTCVIGTDSENNKIFNFNIEVISQEPIKIVHVDFSKDDCKNIILSSIISSKAKNIKFEIKSDDCTYKIYTKNSCKINYLWNLYTKEINYLKPGDYVLTTYAKINNKWETCDNGHFKFKIKDTNSDKEKNLSIHGLNFISKMEGFMSHSYRDVANYLTIGYGELIQPNEFFYNNLTQAEGIISFKKKCSEYISAVNNFLIDSKVKFNQNQFDALVSFSYNLGISWMKNSNNYLRELILNSNSKNIIKHGYVNSETGLNLREHPDINSKSLKVLSYNTKVKILNFNKINDYWYHVELKINKNNKLTGYCYSDYLDIKNSCENKNLNLVDKENFIKEFLRYHHITKKNIIDNKIVSEKKCCIGLLNRRIMELDIFLNNEYPTKANYHKYPVPDCITDEVSNFFVK